MRVIEKEKRELGREGLSMAKLSINEDRLTEGKITVNRMLVETEQGAKIHVEGALRTKDYIEEITQIDAPRFSVKGVKVLQESFGSEDEEIVYTFVAESLEVEE
jgi:hypothetical protein